MNSGWWSPVARGLLFSVIFSLSALVFSAIEPFGIDDAMDRHSREVLYRAFASHYGAGKTDPETFAVNQPSVEAGNAKLDIWKPMPTRADVDIPAQDRIVTVYLSEVVLKALGNANRLDDAGQESTGSWQAWRPTYNDHALLIFELATLYERFADANEPFDVRPPPAIFFDFIFLDKGSTRDEIDQFNTFIETIRLVTREDTWRRSSNNDCKSSFQKLACIKEVGGIPLIFARGVDVDPLTEGEDTPPAQAALSEVAILSPVRFTSGPGAYPLSTTGLSASEEREYFSRRGTQAERLPTPAALAYLAWCMDRAGKCSWIDPDPEENDRLKKMASRFERFLEEPAHDLSLIWGSGVPHYFSDMEVYATGETPGLKNISFFGMTSKDEMAPDPDHDDFIVAPSANSRIICYQDASWAMMLGRLLFNKGQADSSSSMAALTQPCPYHLEVPYYAIGGNDISESMARAIFNGRIIIVGARFRNSSDWASSVVHGQVAGMHLHAMALDNLLTDHDHYLRSPYDVPVFARIPGFGRLDEGDLYETAVMFFITLVGVIGQFTMNRRLIHQAQELEGLAAPAKRPNHWLLYLMTFFTMLLVTFGAVYFQVLILKMAPLNWIGMLVLSWGFFGFLLRDEIGDDVSRLLRKTPLLKASGGGFLDARRRILRYLDMETIGFEATTSIENARDEKDRIVSKLYPESAGQEAGGELVSVVNAAGDENVGPTERVEKGESSS